MEQINPETAEALHPNLDVYVRRLVDQEVSHSMGSAVEVKIWMGATKRIKQIQPWKCSLALVSLENTMLSPTPIAHCP
jgi:hypothetical protein